MRANKQMAAQHDAVGLRSKFLMLAAVLGAAVMRGCKSSAPQKGAPAAQPPPEAVALVEKAKRDVAAQEQLVAEKPQALFVPPGLEGRRPLLVFLHGLGGSGEGLVNNLQLKAWAALKGFVLLAPEGATNYSGRQYWNATGSCCDFENKGLDHVGQLREWIQGAVGLPSVDPKRVYLVGFSNGGYLAHRAACDMAPLLRGIVSIAGAAPGKTESCEPLQPVSVVQIHGTQDPIVAFEGGYLFKDTRRPKHPSAEQSLAGWAKVNGCEGELLATDEHLNLDERLPGAETQVHAYPGCKKQPVQLWRIEGGDHSSGLSRRSIDAIWQYVEGQG